MTSGRQLRRCRSRSTLPSPHGPLADAAHVAAYIWARPMDPARHGRAVSQLYSVLRDLGIAARGLARYQTTDITADPASPDFARHVDSERPMAAQHLHSLDGVLAAEGIGPVPDPTNPARSYAGQHATRSWRGGSHRARAPTRHHGQAVHHGNRVPVRCDAEPGDLRAAAPYHRPARRMRQPRRGHRLPDRSHPGARRGCLTRTWHTASPAHGKLGTSCQATRTFRAPDPPVPLNRSTIMAKDLDISMHVAGQHAVAAFEAIAVYAQERLRSWTAASGEGGRDPAKDHYRLSGMLCALWHLADKVPEVSFHSVLEDGTREYLRQRADYPQRTVATGAAAAARAIGACHRSINAPSHYHGSVGPRTPSPACANTPHGRA